MAGLSFSDLMTLEAAFGMASGYVLDFSNTTFQSFIFECVHRNIYEPRYARLGESKAKRLREFWKIEPNHVVGKVVEALTEHASRIGSLDEQKRMQLDRCSKIAHRLKQGAPVLLELGHESREDTFDALAHSVRQAIGENRPEAGLDRLHTFFVSYLRKLCEARGVPSTRDEPAHSLMGKYVKALKTAGRIESEMTGKILTYAIATMDAFNRVRNEQSLAHPNPMLNYQESLLIYSHVVSIVHFIKAIEEADPTNSAPTTDDLPF